MAERGIRCSLECEDRDGNPRYCSPNSESTICSVCRGNMAGWSLRLAEAKAYESQLAIRTRRIGEVTHPAGSDSYIAQLKAKRRRRAH